MNRIWWRLKKFDPQGVTFGAVLIAAAAVSFAATSAPLSVPAPLDTAPATFDPPLRIIAFGSSSTEGRGATNPAATYPAQLQGILSGMLPNGRKVQVINRGIGGEDADDMIRRLKDDVIDRQPDLVIWQTGSNDPMRHVPIARFEEETRDGIDLMRSSGIRVILMEPQWCPRLETISTANDYRDAIRRIGRDMNVDVIRRSDLMHDWIHEGMLTQKEMLASDGLHMTDGGYALLARSAARQVMKVEDIRVSTQTTATAIP